MAACSWPPWSCAAVSTSSEALDGINATPATNGAISPMPSHAFHPICVLGRVPLRISPPSSGRHIGNHSRLLNASGVLPGSLVGRTSSSG